MKITVVIPTHNRLSSLVVAVRSVFEQSVLPAELVVVDDGSDEPVSNEIFNGAPMDVRCVLLRSEQPKGANNARNVGVQESTSEYIAFLDDDDVFNPSKIRELSKAIQKYPYADVIYHPALIHMANEGVCYVSKPAVFKDGESAFRQLLIRNQIGGTSMVAARRQSLLSVGLFDDQMPALQDYEMWLRLSKANKNFVFVDMPLTNYFYYTKADSISKGIEKNAAAILYIENKYAADYALLSGHDLREHDSWKRKMIVHKLLLNGHRFSAFKEQLMMFLRFPGVANLASVFVVALGPTFTFKLKARFSK